MLRTKDLQEALSGQRLSLYTIEEQLERLYEKFDVNDDQPGRGRAKAITRAIEVGLVGYPEQLITTHPLINEEETSIYQLGLSSI